MSNFVKLESFVLGWFESGPKVHLVFIFTVTVKTIVYQPQPQISSMIKFWEKMKGRGQQRPLEFFAKIEHGQTALNFA